MIDKKRILVVYEVHEDGAQCAFVGNPAATREFMRTQSKPDALYRIALAAKEWEDIL